MKVGPRLAVGFGIVLVLMLALTGVAISRMAFIRASLDQIVEQDAAKLRLVNSMRDLVRYQSVTVRDVVMQEDFAFKKKELLLAKQSKETYRKAAEQLTALFVDPQGKAAMAAIAERDAKVRLAIDQAVELSLSGAQQEAADTIRDKVRPAQIELVGALEALLERVETGSRESAARAGQTYDSAVLLMTIFGGLAVLVGVAAALLITRSLLTQLGGEPVYAARIADRIAAGDLAVQVELKPHDQGSLLFSMRGMRDGLADLVGQVRLSTETIATASGQIASGNLDLSSRTEEQAGTLGETASSMGALHSTVQQNAANAHRANGLAVSASDVAKKGGAVVAQVVSTMGSINDSARKIVDIIGVIDGIAFQTNILALNAAVEAARAGEQGRGFAVVASEVRNLAQRSAAAAKEIKTLIGDSVEKVDIGAKLVDQAGATMEEIVESVKRVTDIISEIAAANEAQTSGIGQINQAVSQMDEATQQNAALVEEAAAAADSLREQADHLTQVVNVFKLDDAHTAAASAPPRASASVRTLARPARPAAGPAIAPPARRPAAARTGTDDDWEEF
ncbi:methyl-accepting chemotaxis protein [Pseudoduganella namucuonensis]